MLRVAGRFFRTEIELSFEDGTASKANLFGLHVTRFRVRRVRLGLILSLAPYLYSLHAITTVRSALCWRAAGVHAPHLVAVVVVCWCVRGTSAREGESVLRDG